MDRRINEPSQLLEDLAFFKVIEQPLDVRDIAFVETHRDPDLDQVTAIDNILHNNIEAPAAVAQRPVLVVIVTHPIDGDAHLRQTQLDVLPDELRAHQITVGLQEEFKSDPPALAPKFHFGGDAFKDRLVHQRLTPVKYNI